MFRNVIEKVYIRVRFLVSIVLYRRKIPRILTTEDTLKTILSNGLSISRYGDGELCVMCGGGIGFCSKNSILSTRLREVLMSNEANHLVCVPYMLKSTKGMKKQSKRFWKNTLAFELGLWCKMMDCTSPKGDSLVSRFWIDFLDKDRADRVVELWKQVWNGREVLIVEGENTRMGIGNDLFDNVKSIQRVICPSKDAFEKYDEILASVKSNADGKLVLIALGPVATVLAYDLCKDGIQAIDLGHIDVEYEWYKMGAIEKVKISGKDVNEVKGGLTLCNNGNYYASNEVVCMIR